MFCLISGKWLQKIILVKPKVKTDNLFNQRKSGYQLWITAVAGYISMVGGLCALFPVFGQWTPPYHCKSPLDDQFSSLSFAEILTLHQSNYSLNPFSHHFIRCSWTGFL